MGNINEKIVKYIEISDEKALILVNDCDPQYKQNEKTLLEFACEYGREKTANRLLDRKCIISPSAFKFACEKNMQSIIKRLKPNCSIFNELQLYCAYKLKSNIMNMIPQLPQGDDMQNDINRLLFVIVEYGNVEVFDLFMTTCFHCDINQKYEYPCYPIHLACMNQNNDIAMRLLNIGCTTLNACHGYNLLDLCSGKCTTSTNMMETILKLIELGETPTKPNVFSHLLDAREIDAIIVLINRLSRTFMIRHGEEILLWSCYCNVPKIVNMLYQYNDSKKLANKTADELIEFNKITIDNKNMAVYFNIADPEILRITAYEMYKKK